MLTKLNKKLVFVAFLLVIAGIIYLSLPVPTPPDNFDCRFKAEKTNGAPPFGQIRKPILSVRVFGHVAEPFDDVMYEFTGNAVVEIPGETIKAAARGKVFIAENGQPDGLQLTIKDSRFGADGLRISTLNKNGILGSSTTKAFIYSDPMPSASFRLSYPAEMNCSASIDKQ